MAAEIVQFLPVHIPVALKLWTDTPGVRLTDMDTPVCLTRYLDRNPGLSVAAVDHESLVGTLLCGHDGRRAYLQHLAVADSYRRSGLGRRMIAHVLAALHHIEITKCHVFVGRDNPFGELFWERIGWEQRADLNIYSASTEWAAPISDAHPPAISG